MKRALASRYGWARLGTLALGAAVWASLALCVFFSLERELPRYRTAPVAEWSAQTPVGHGTKAVRGMRSNPSFGMD